MKLTQANLSEEFVVLSPEKSASKVKFTPTVFEELNQNYNGFKGHELISVFEFSEDWPTWEMHPKGDEIVILLSGKITFVLDLNNQQQSITIEEVGSYVIVPKGIWHTAKTDTPTKMLFITPGEGTENKNI